MPPKRRIWGIWSYAGYWAILNISIWTWSVGAALLSLGLNIQHAMGALTLGNIFIVLYTTLNSQPGNVYHIGFTVCQRFVFGIFGSWLGILIRIILSIVYYGSQAWLGGLCFVVIFSSWSESYMNMKNTFPESAHMTTRDFIGFLIFQVIQIPFAWIKPERMNKFNNFACIICLAAMMSMWIYLMALNKGPGPIYYEKVELSPSQTGYMWLYAMTVWYGALSPDITNQSDFSRFAESPRKLYIGVFIGIFFTEMIPLAGLLSASVSTELYGQQYWLPTDICMQWLGDHYTPRTRCACFFLSFCFMVSELSLNVLSNGFAGAIDLASVFPRAINIKRGYILIALLSWACCPWTFYNTNSTFLTVMSSFGVIVTPIIAILVTDFTFVRKNKLKLNDLYSASKDGAFYYTFGVNWRAIFVFIATVAPGLPGLAQGANPTIVLKTGIVNYFYCSIVISFVFPAVLYYIIAVYIFPIKNLDDYSGEDFYEAFTLEECKALDLIPYSGVNLDHALVLEDFTNEENVGSSSSRTSFKGKVEDISVKTVIEK